MRCYENDTHVGVCAAMKGYAKTVSRCKSYEYCWTCHFRPARTFKGLSRAALLFRIRHFKFSFRTFIGCLSCRSVSEMVTECPCVLGLDCAATRNDVSQDLDQIMVKKLRSLSRALVKTVFRFSRHRQVMLSMHAQCAQ